jgi:solute carrier family 8 (sodium/calcium exchanger)
MSLFIISPYRTRRFVVDSKKLLELFSTCNKCSFPTLPEVVTRGFYVAVHQQYSQCQTTRSWTNQDIIGNIPAINLDFSAAVLFSGALPTKSLRMMSFMGVKAISYRTFMQHQQTLLQPAINQLWTEKQQTLLQSMKEEPAILSGDGRCDSPGHCAKFGTYSLLDLRSGKVVAVEVVQVILS